MRDYYDYPTQVMFGVERDDDTIETLTGIAYQDFVICLECGEVLPLQAGQFDHGFEELSWISLTDECLADSTLDDSVKNTPINFQKLTHIKATFKSGDATLSYLTEYPAEFSKEDIETDLLNEYVEWIKEVCKPIVPAAMLDRFNEFVKEYGVSDDEFHWEYID